MLPVQVLIDEHKLILQMVGLLKKESDKISQTKKVDLGFVIVAVDFFRTYADRFHHGKEEGILFKALYRRKMSAADRKMMNELTLEHALARKTVGNLENTMKSHAAGNTEAEKEVLVQLEVLIKLYPEHIKKEDTQFFISSMQYFTDTEKDKMQSDFAEFNCAFTDKKYAKTVEDLQA